MLFCTPLVGVHLRTSPLTNQLWKSSEMSLPLVSPEQNEARNEAETLQLTERYLGETQQPAEHAA